jgi:hypothetical protein
MVDRRRLVVVVVIYVQPRSAGAPLGDEVDELLERPLLPLPVEGPEGRVPRSASSRTRSVAILLGMTSRLRDRTVTANRLQFGVLEAGTGPLALCLHGFPDDVAIE